MHIDSFVGVGAQRRFLGDLKDRALKGNGVVFSYRAPILETQSLIDLKGTDFSPGGQSVSRWLAKSTVMHGKVALKDFLCLRFGFGSGQSQLTHQPVLKGSPQSLDTSLGLGGAG